ncbi:MAG: cyclic nucleotide-binding domain-containing protein [Turneriella sp.]|nr:cyclic nucleotide-binding domain-containing protein [Turneriella sp.]
MKLEIPEFSTAARLFAYQFFIVAANVAARASRDTFLMQGSYAKHLPLLIAFTAVVMYIVVRAQTLFAGGRSPVVVAALAPLIAAASYVAFWALPMTGPASAIYFIWTEVVNSLLSVQFWILATAVLDMRTGKKLFGLIGAGGAIGGLAAGLVLAPLGKKLGAAFLPLSAGIMLLAAIPFVLGMKARGGEEGGSSTAAATGTEWNLFHPYIKILCFLLIPATIVSTLVDYQFKIVSAAAIPDAGQLAAYYARYYAILNGLTLAFQIFVTSFFLTRLGLLFSLLFLPLALTLFMAPMAPLSLTAGSAALPILVMLSFAGRLSDQTVKFTIYQGAFQLLWLPVPPLHKPALKMSVEAVIKNGIAGVAGLGAAAAAYFYPPKGESFFKLQITLAIITTAFLLLWLVAAFLARQGYRKYLVESLGSRIIDFSTESIEINSPEIRETLRHALLSNEEGRVAFALDILSNQDLTGWEADLQAIFSASSGLIQARILELAEKQDTLLGKQFVLDLAAHEGSQRITALVIATRRKYAEVADILSSVPGGTSYAATMALCCRALLAGRNEQLVQKFNDLIGSEDVETKATALKAAAHFPELIDLFHLRDALEHSDGEIRRLALDVTRAGQKHALIREVMLNLGDAKTYATARATLAVIHPLVVQNELESSEYFNTTNADMVYGIFRFLGVTGSAASLSLLLRHMSATNPRLFSAACKSTVSLIDAVGKTPEIKQLIERRIEEACGLYLVALKLLDSKSTFAGERALVAEWLEIAMARWIIGACRLATAGQGITNIQARFEGRHLRAAKRGEFLEIIENSASAHAKALLIRILDGKSDSDVIQKLEPQFKALPKPGKAWLRAGDAWQAAMATLIVLGSDGDANKRWRLLTARPLPALAEEILIRKIQPRAARWREALSSRHLLSFDRHLNKSAELGMYPTLEKILLLKSVGMFSDISGEDISRLIQISREVEMPAGTQVFHTGEEGHELFILLAGEIKIHRDGRDLAVLKRGDFLGEMALLDNEPRSADATTVTDCKLLSIGQRDFFDVLSGRPEILKAILRLLSGRLRKSIQAAGATA